MKKIFFIVFVVAPVIAMDHDKLQEKTTGSDWIIDIRDAGKKLQERKHSTAVGTGWKEDMQRKARAATESANTGELFQVFNEIFMNALSDIQNVATEADKKKIFTSGLGLLTGLAGLGLLAYQTHMHEC